MELITIGDKQIPVVAQRHARLRHLLGKADYQSLLSGNYGAESYRLLSVLVPELPSVVPEWEWDGYASPENQRDSVYLEEADRSPTTDQIVAAFETVLRVNGVGRLGKIMDLVTMAMKQVGREVQMPTLPDSPGSTGGST